MSAKVNLENIAVILVKTQIPENIGAAARAMNNMGLSRLLLVEPKDQDPSRILKPATGSTVDIIEKMEVFDDLKEALGPFEYVVGTTARTGSLRPAMTQPRRLAHDLVSISQENQVAVLFGPEVCGLSNEHLRYCHSIASIPTARFPSLNIAQAVMIICYELFMAGVDAQPKHMPRLANKFELEGMYDHLSHVLMKIGFLDRQNPEHWMLRIRRFFSRYPLRAVEVKLIRGICRRMSWCLEQLESLQQEKKGPNTEFQGLMQKTTSPCREKQED